MARHQTKMLVSASGQHDVSQELEQILQVLVEDAYGCVNNHVEYPYTVTL
jgi:hypothetical protein